VDFPQVFFFVGLGVFCAINDLISTIFILGQGVTGGGGAGKGKGGDRGAIGVIFLCRVFFLLFSFFFLYSFGFVSCHYLKTKEDPQSQRKKTKIMSGYTESAVLDKFAKLNDSQESIQTLSQWIMYHRKHAATSVRLWAEAIQKGHLPGLTLLLHHDRLDFPSSKRTLQLDFPFSGLLDLWTHFGPPLPSWISPGATKRIFLEVIGLWSDSPFGGSAF